MFKQQVLALLEEGHSQSAVARAAGCTRQYVSLLAREDRRRVTLTPLGKMVAAVLDRLGDTDSLSAEQLAASIFPLDSPVTSTATEG